MATMKLQVQVKTPAKTPRWGDTHQALQLIVGSYDTVRSVKERVSAIEPPPFPEQDLVFAGKVLGDDETLIECGIEDGSSVDFSFRASEDALVQQLLELLQARAVAPEELGLMYCHRYGLTAGSALQAIGSDEQLHDFLKRHDCFVVEGGHASSRSKKNGKDGKPTRREVPLERIPKERPSLSTKRGHDERFQVRVSIVLEVPSNNGKTSNLDLTVHSAETVLDIKNRICSTELIPFLDRRLHLSGGELEDKQRLGDCEVKDGTSLDLAVAASEEALAQQLVELLQARALSLNELSLLYSCRHGVPVSRALKILGCCEQLAGFLQRQPYFSLDGPGVRLVDEAALQNRRLLEKHDQISSTSFREEVAGMLDRTVAAVLAASFLHVSRAVKGGSVGRGTAIAGAADAEVVLFLEGLPPTGRERWLPGLRTATAATLQAQICDGHGIESVTVAGDSVQVRMGGDFMVNLLFSPIFASYRDAINTLGAHRDYALAMAEQKVHFIAKQPEAVKTTIRLLKWWRQQHPWSTALTRPSDELLELVAAHTAVQSKPLDQQEAMKSSMALLVDFDRACITWPDSEACYCRADVPEALLWQRPLVMDPVNPLMNVAEPRVFDPHEMMMFAKSPVFA